MVNDGNPLRLTLRPAPPHPPLNANAPQFEPGKPWAGKPGIGFAGVACARSASPPGDGFHPHHLLNDCTEDANSLWAGARQITVSKKVGKAILHFDWSVSALVMYDKDPEPRYMPCMLSPGSRGPLLIVPRATTESGDACVSITLPAGQLSHEIFATIAEMVSRDDLKNLRLVNKEFERHVSSTYFNTAVVSFTTEVYDAAIEDETHQSDKSKGKKRARDARDFNKEAEPSKRGTIGLRLFQSYGTSMLRFAMAFEVTEDQLCGLPVTTEQEGLAAYHGGYSWPAERNSRYPTLLALQLAAEQDSRMKTALSHLEHVNELGLCVDDGLGWLNGQDISVRGRIFSRPSKVFHASLARPDSLAQGATDLWSAILQSQWEIGRNRDLKKFDLQYRELDPSVKKRLPTKLPQHADHDSWRPLQKKILFQTLPQFNSSGHGSGFFIGSNTESECSNFCTRSPLVPSYLTEGQREWLLQTTWAQDAFVATYRLAIINNPLIAAKVTTLNIAKLSSGLMHVLGLGTVLQSLTALANVKIMISPDWQSIERDVFEVAQATHIQPTQAITAFQTMLNSVALKESVKNLCIGWVGGGEHAEGMLARNAHIMPAPIPMGQDLHGPVASTHLLALPYVKHLTFVNCWFSPQNLEALITLHQNLELKKLTLDSVSLTADTSVPRSWVIDLDPTTYSHPEAFRATVSNRLSPHKYYSHLTMCRFVNRPRGLAPAPAPGPPLPPPAGTHWSRSMRKGSWPDLLDRVSPGPTLDDYLVPDAEPAERVTKLAELELISCGYIRLDHTMPFSQEEVGTTPLTPDAWFTSRGMVLADKVLPQTDTLLGWIVQWMPEYELLALRNAWGLREGWTDATKAEEATYDGLLPGGTGRVSGVIKKGMGLYQ